jgi:predicted acyltransferase
MEPVSAQTKPRLLSLDVLRGITVAAMILVNNPGDWGHIYAPLEHAAWNGCTPTDLIFPFFLFIVGVSIVYALQTKKTQDTGKGKMMLSIAQRALTIIALGIFLSLYPKFDFHTVRIPGVLTRIGLVYGASAFIYIYTDRKTQLWLFWILLIFYYIIMTLVPVPGVGYANLQPETNLGACIDRNVFGEAHLWKESVTWDPEGLLGTIPAMATGLFGILVGTWLKRKDVDETTKVAWLFSVGIVNVMAGLLWGLFFPINKALWTSSYVLYAGGLACLGLALLYWIIDVQGYRKYTRPFVVYGVNAITVFFFSAFIVKTMNLITLNLDGKKIASKEYLYQLFYAPYLSPYNASLAGAVTFVLIWLGILWVMYNKNIIIKV